MAYWLSKILPLALLPLGLSLILLLVGLIGRLRWPVITAAVLLWLFSLGLVSQILWRWLESPWQRQSAAKAASADAIVVLSGGRHPVPGAARVSEWHDPDRFFAGLELYRYGKAPLLLFTGGVSPFRPGEQPEGQRYLVEAQQLGIPASAMETTLPVVNTAQEANAIYKLLQGSDRLDSSPSILLVTSAFHMRRAQRLFERQGLRVVPFPVDFQARGNWAGPLWRDPIQWIPTAGALDGSSRALRELLGRLVYRTW
ncbi:hypothetical protein SynBIOSE41_00323 [Synechococcus sp. BIOS-E4-1]|uniref:YdcF family protein n=1 Tax=Synechococcus sp. BIOS-E4-1 TaxID=1400864 RepID=UPI001648577C|nr:YdcF family protein [Synechococcus sp. BIOS-E4-1]QNI52892.1 hypothetical protein SynBIOSE41_00323 [Synechococcus sp. BIOS-E4-1]